MKRGREVTPEEVPPQIMAEIDRYGEAMRKIIREGVVVIAIALVYASGGEMRVVTLDHWSAAQSKKRRIKERFRKFIRESRARGALIISAAEWHCTQHDGPTSQPLWASRAGALVLEYRDKDRHYTAVQMYERESDGSIRFDDMIINEATTELADGWFAGCKFAA